MINRAYIEVMTDGDASGRVFTFPIPTYNITHDFDWDSENADRLFAMTAKYGLPYFQNFLNSELKPGDVRSMCCRLQLDLRELLKRGNGLFGSAEQTGSLGVVTVNCARLGLPARGRRDGLLAALDRLLDLARDVARAQADGHRSGTSTRGCSRTRGATSGTLDNHFSTIGVNGLNEMVRNFTGDAHDLTDPEGPRARRRGCSTTCARGWCEFQEETGHLYNLEATPGGGHDVPLRQGGPPPVPGDPAGRDRRQPVLHQLLAAAGGLHRRPVRGPRAPGRAADQVHGRHGAAPVHGRAALDARRRPRAGPARAVDGSGCRT